MTNEVIDLTKNRPNDVFKTFYPSDVVLIVTTGVVGFIAKEAWKYFFPGIPSLVEQLRVLEELIEACGKAGATSLRVRISTNTERVFQLPKIAEESKILGKDSSTVDLEILFHAPRKTRRTKVRPRGKSLRNVVLPHTPSEPSLAG